MTDKQQDDIIFEVDRAIIDLEQVIDFLKTINYTKSIGDGFTLKELEHKLKFQRASLRIVTTDLYML